MHSIRHKFHIKENETTKICDDLCCLAQEEIIISYKGFCLWEGFDSAQIYRKLNNFRIVKSRRLTNFSLIH